MIYVAWRQIRIGRFAAITRDGVVYRAGVLMRIRRLSWSDVEIAKLDSGVVYLHAPRDRAPRRRIDVFNKRHGEAKAFMLAVNETAGRFRSPGNAVERDLEQA